MVVLEAVLRYCWYLKYCSALEMIDTLLVPLSTSSTAVATLTHTVVFRLGAGHN